MMYLYFADFGASQRETGDGGCCFEIIAHLGPIVSVLILVHVDCDGNCNSEKS